MLSAGYLYGLLVAFGIGMMLDPDQFVPPLLRHGPVDMPRDAIEKELESLAVIDRLVMVPMRDGQRMAADIYRPKDTSKKYPVLFGRSPYNFIYRNVGNNFPPILRPRSKRSDTAMSGSR
jgi:hypothetical protein